MRQRPPPSDELSLLHIPFGEHKMIDDVLTKTHVIYDALGRKGKTSSFVLVQAFERMEITPINTVRLIDPFWYTTGSITITEFITSYRQYFPLAVVISKARTKSGFWVYNIFPERKREYEIHITKQDDTKQERFWQDDNDADPKGAHYSP